MIAGKMKPVTTVAALAVLLVSVGAAGVEPVSLSAGGQSRYQIVLAGSASPSEQYAAQELQAHFKACTGVELPIAAEAPGGDIPMIVLGCGPLAQSLGVDPKPEDLGEQGYVIRTAAPHLVIAGTPAAGTMYGVYDFLENCLGVRWYAPDVTKTPKTPRGKRIPLPEIDRTVRPAFAWRNISYTWPGGDEVFRTRVRDNAGKGGPDNARGVQYAFAGQAHSYFSFISPDEFFDTHPEYFSEIGGVRRREETQLCLTNPEVLEIVTERMLARMAENPGLRQFNFSQMDYYSYCECAQCKAINAQYATMGGTQFWFVNQLAERTSKQFPDKLIGTLAYTYTEEPPKDVTMHPNVAIWLCHMFPSCDSHPIDSCPLNADYKRRAEAWSRICSHLYVWHYIVDFGHYFNPFPNFRAMAADMRFYHRIGVEGIFLQGMGHAGGGGEWSMLRPYYGMKLLWNPEQDADAIIEDFLQGYYGAAWEPLWKYIQILQNKVEKEQIHMHLYTNPAQGYLTNGILKVAGLLFDQAEAAVKNDDELLERVRVARMPLTYARIFPRNGYTLENGKLAFKGDLAQMPETQAFIERMQKHGFTTIREMGGDPQQLLMWTAAGMTPLPYATIKSKDLAVDVVAFLGGRALRITENATGQCVTAHNISRNLYFPFCGGEESRTGGVYESPTSVNVGMFNVVEQTETSITLEIAAGPCKLQRVLTVAPDAPALTVRNILTNTSDKAVQATVRSHLELDLGKVAQTHVAFTSRAGQQVDKDMPSIIAGLREGEHYLDQNAPNGKWTFSGTKGLQVTQSFDAAQLDFTWLYAYPESLNELEIEVWPKSVLLEPGQATEFSHTIEVRPSPR